MAEPSSSTTSSSLQLQGPRPAPLRARRDSHNIRKAVRQPVIIYTASPKVVHAEPSEFMSVVQRLTGGARSKPQASSSLPEPPGDHQHSLQPFPFLPSPSMPHFPFQLHHQQAAPAGVFDVVGGHSLLPPLPSILSPVPGSLPAVPPSFFSPPPGASGGGGNLFGELISPAFLAATTTTGGASATMHPTSSPHGY
jgi:MAP kinase substrate 1